MQREVEGPSRWPLGLSPGAAWARTGVRRCLLFTLERIAGVVAVERGGRGRCGSDLPLSLGVRVSV